MEQKAEIKEIDNIHELINNHKIKDFNPEIHVDLVDEGYIVVIGFPNYTKELAWISYSYPHWPDHEWPDNEKWRFNSAFKKRLDGIYDWAVRENILLKEKS